MPDAVERLPDGVCIVRPYETIAGGSRLNYSLGISRETCGSTRLAMSLVIVPPGGAARPHYHVAAETIIHVLKGRAETRYGQHLAQSIISEAGDFLHIGAHVPHAPHNLSDTDESVAINARSDPAQQEAIMPVEPTETLVVNWQDVTGVAAPSPEHLRLIEEGGWAYGMVADGLTLQRVEFRPKAEGPYRHTPIEVAAYLAHGTLDLRFGEREQYARRLCAGEFVFVPSGVAHAWRNDGDDTAVVVLARVS